MERTNIIDSDETYELTANSVVEKLLSKALLYEPSSRWVLRCRRDKGVLLAKAVGFPAGRDSLHAATSGKIHYSLVSKMIFEV